MTPNKGLASGTGETNLDKSNIEEDCIASFSDEADDDNIACDGLLA